VIQKRKFDLKYVIFIELDNQLDLG